MLESLDDLLQASGCRTSLHSSAESFLHSTQRKHVDLLISDIGLPGMSGIELLRSLRRAAQELPAILITGRSETHCEEDATALGVALLSKPFDTNELLKHSKPASDSSGGDVPRYAGVRGSTIVRWSCLDVWGIRSECRESSPFSH